MKQITDNKESIFELQTMLREIEYAKSQSTPELIADGIYSGATSEAVREFQKENGIPPTGITDNETWDKIRSEYLIALKKNSPPRSICPFPDVKGYEIKYGESSDLVGILQYMLKELSTVFEYINVSKTDGIFGKETENSIKEFQKAYGFEETGAVNKMTWDALADAFNMSVGKKG